jgi:4,5:9,10-diseco-3-hydroxy-5,9,17-trioxoandrosta-1(10),2-diene-4-oate hydrolase
LSKGRWFDKLTTNGDKLTTNGKGTPRTEIRLEAPLKHKTVALNGVNIHYVEAGEGPAVLLMHGLGSSLDTWRRNVQPLADAGYKILAPDLPGHGDSDKPKSLRYDPLAAVDFTIRFLDALGVQKASLVGNSAGGLVAAMFALEYPERTDRLTLVAPGGLGRQISWFLRLMSVPVIGEFLYHPWTYNLMGINKRVFHEPSSVPDGVFAEMARVHALPGSIRATLRSLRSSINFMGLRPEWQVLDRLSQISAPLMCLWGEQDNVIPISHSGLIKNAIPQSLVRTLPQCGHWPHMEKADEFNTLLTRFLEGGLDDQNGSIPGPIHT